MRKRRRLLPRRDSRSPCPIAFGVTPEAYRPMMENLVAALRRMAQEPNKQPLTMSDTETLAVTTPSLNMLHVRYDVAL